MNTREIATEYRLAHWSGIMQERQAKGISIKEYCRQIGISGNTYFYWQRKLRESAVERLSGQESNSAPSGLTKVSFAEVRMSQYQAAAADYNVNEPGCLRIEVSGIRMATDGSYPTSKLSELLRELVRPC